MACQCIKQQYLRIHNSALLAFEYKLKALNITFIGYPNDTDLNEKSETTKYLPGIQKHICTCSFLTSVIGRGLRLEMCGQSDISIARSVQIRSL